MPRILFDTHCHLHFRAYENDREAVIRRAKDAGVFMITVGTDYETSRDAVAIAQTDGAVWASVGLHPNHLFPYPVDLSEEAEPTVEIFDPTAYRTLAANPRVVAIGECGLDYYRIPSSLDSDVVKAQQEKTFRAHLDLADELRLPVIIHCRDAHNDVQRILREYTHQGKLTRRGVIHCFTGTKAEALAYLPLDFFISFTGIVTFPPRKGAGESLDDVLRALPSDRILLETDAPYLAPIPHRGKQNEPAYVQFVAGHIARVRDVPFEQVADTTTQNAISLFSLPNHSSTTETF